MKKKHSKFHSILTLVLFLSTSVVCFGQSPDFNKINLLIKKGENFDAIKLLKSVDPKKISKNELARTYFYLGKAYGNENINDKSFSYLKKSEKIYLEIDSIPSAMEVKLEIAYALTSEDLNYKTTKKYYNEYITYAKGTKDSKLITKGYFKMASFLMYDEPNASTKYFYKALQENKTTKDDRAYSHIIFNLAVVYAEKLNQRDSALQYYQKALIIQKKYNEVDNICANYMNQAGVYNFWKQYDKAINLLNKAADLPITMYTKNIKSQIHLYLSSNYAGLGNYHKAYQELSLYQETSNQEVFERQNKQISDLQTKYDIKEREVENLNLKVKTRNSLLLVYLVVSLLFIGSIIGFLRIKYLSKKKQIAEQEKLIETQKLENVLKEQELLEIDKILEGQEKERIKIANDLHDNLGSLMATLKLNFQNLKRSNENLDEEEAQLYDKTDEMINEAYQKVRGLAHTKNAGVIANEGLLPAIINIAKKATIPGKLKIQVVPFGLDERLENSIEVNIFRMVQEIITNAIKHAEASEITINLTQHSDSLNIIIEDNGKGFVPTNKSNSEGMGLANIEKKVEQMGGSFTIDSSKGKGTSIIIDIPL